MKFKLLALIFAVASSSVTADSDPAMLCFVMSADDPYTAFISVLNNMNVEPFNSFPLCDISHPPGLSDNDVVAITIVGSSTLIIPAAVCESFPLAKSLKASNAQLNQTGDLYACGNLVHLDLSENNINEIDANAFSTTQLKSLDLSRNALVYTNPKGLKNLKELEVLDLSFNPEIEISNGLFSYASHLKEFYLSNSGLTSIRASWFNNFTELVRLDLSHNPLTDIPNGAFDVMESITTLDMNSCK